MKGGYQILDLRCVGLEMSSETQNFTNEEVLKQLRNLRDHIEKEHAYAKPLRNGLKAIMIRYRDAKSGELLEMCGFADIVSSNESLTYEIIAKDLRIEVVFEEKTDEVGNKYFDIKTAKYLYNKNVIIDGDLTVGGNAKLFENIVDKDGHLRFIEGNGAVATDIHINEEGLYCKWSLSGSHLMFVLAGSFDSGTSIPSGTFASFELPKWIMDKIYPVFSSRVEIKEVALYNEDWSTEDSKLVLVLTKATNSLMSFINVQTGFTITKDRSFRIQCDLLIDNE